MREDKRFEILDVSPFKELLVRNFEIGMRADTFLARRMPHRSRNGIQKILAEEKITLRGRLVKASYRVKSTDVFWLSIIPSDQIVGDNEAVQLDYLYEDDHIVAVNKGPDIVVHPTGRRLAGTVIQAVYLRMKGQMTANPDMKPRLLHRLDRETSGVLIISKYNEIHRVLQRQFEQRRISKEYVAILEGDVKEDAGEIELPIARDRSSGIGLKMAVDEKRGQHAVTRYEVSERLDGYTVVRARPLTGRQHQIRVHFAAIGHPVVDDLIYKDQKVFLEYVERGLNVPEGFHVLGRHALHAAQLKFYYPPEGAELTIRAPLLRDMADFIRAHRRTRG